MYLHSRIGIDRLFDFHVSQSNIIRLDSPEISFTHFTYTTLGCIMGSPLISLGLLDILRASMKKFFFSLYHITYSKLFLYGTQSKKYRSHYIILSFYDAEWKTCIDFTMMCNNNFHYFIIPFSEYLDEKISSSYSIDRTFHLFNIKNTNRN